jgi:hypothetical protein
MSRLYQQRAGVLYQAPPLSGTPDWETIEYFDDPVFQVKRRHEHFRHRQAEGHRCFGYRDAGQVVCYLWLTTGKAAPLFLNTKLIVPPDVVYIWDCRTVESHQARGYYTRGLLAARAVIGGARQFQILAEDPNLPSEKAILRSGFKPSCHVRVFRFGILPFIAVNDGLPRPLVSPWRPPE